jgi:CubicO group peptidase (beta-lactamase class C family)
LTSTVEDMARFVSLQFRTGKAGGSQILSGATLREMHRVRMLENNWRRGNGIGFAVSRVKDKTYIGHGGSLAGYKTHTLIQLDDKVGVVVLSNGDDSRPNQMAERLMQTVGQAVAKAAEPEKKTPRWDDSWRRYAGLYRSLWGDVEVVELNRALVLIDPTAEDLQDQQRLEPVDNGGFRLEAPTGGAAVGEPVRFDEREGRVTRMQIGQVYMERIER